MPKKLVFNATSGQLDTISEVALTAVGSTPDANAASIDANQNLTLQPADGTNPGVITAGVQTIGGAKTFTGAITASNLSGTNTGDQTITLTSDVTGSGTGSFATTLATVNSNVGSFGSASSVASVTVNAKGLTTAASSVAIQIAESQVTNLVSDLAGKQPTGNYITALTSDVTASGPGSAAATIAADAVTNTKLANMPTNTIKGNNTGGSADPIDLTVSQVQSLLSISPSSTGDLSQATFSAANNTASQTVTGFAFANASVRAFRAFVSVTVSATSSLYESFEIEGIQRGSDWSISIMSEGDDSLATFDITNAGQMQITTSNYSGFSTCKVAFRAMVTNV